MKLSFGRDGRRLQQLSGCRRSGRFGRCCLLLVGHRDPVEVRSGEARRVFFGQWSSAGTGGDPKQDGKTYGPVAEFTRRRIKNVEKSTQSDRNPRRKRANLRQSQWRRRALGKAPQERGRSRRPLAQMP